MASGGSTSTSIPESGKTAESDPKVAAMQSRIISHMNADHSASLRLYLRHYCQLPNSWISGKPVILEEITTDHMIISSGGNRTRNLIPFQPPLKSFSESRERLVTMHSSALAGLGLSDTIVNQYIPPNRLYQWVFFIGCLWTFSTLPMRSKVNPASNSFISWVYSLGGTVPALASTVYRVQPIFLGVLVALHAAEAVTMVRTRLQKHQVTPWSRNWWLWTVDTFIEGFGAFNRFDEIVRTLEKKAKKEEKH